MFSCVTYEAVELLYITLSLMDSKKLADVAVACSRQTPSTLCI